VAATNTLYAGTGEPNASNDSEAGVGIYKTTDGGVSWALVPGSEIFFQRAIGDMAFDNQGRLLVPIASAIRGVSSVTSGAVSSASADHPLVIRGLWRQNGALTLRPIVAVAICGIDDRQGRSDASRRDLRQRVLTRRVALGQQRRILDADQNRAQ
jgi:hypothetical protein